MLIDRGASCHISHTNGSQSIRSALPMHCFLLFVNDANPSMTLTPARRHLGHVAASFALREQPAKIKDAQRRVSERDADHRPGGKFAKGVHQSLSLTLELDECHARVETFCQLWMLFSLSGRGLSSHRPLHCADGRASLAHPFDMIAGGERKRGREENKLTPNKRLKVLRDGKIPNFDADSKLGLSALG